jgi:CubicO group peptidase (beta-lactamase class C family)
LRLFLAIIVTFVAAASGLGEPAEHWQNADPAAGLSAEDLKAVQDFGNAAKPTTVMFVQDGRIVAGFGDASRKFNMFSVRKSLLSALYGIAISQGGSISPAGLPSSASTTIHGV